MSFIVIFLPCAVVVYVTVIALYLLDRLNSAEKRLRRIEQTMGKTTDYWRFVLSNKRHE